MLYYQQRDQAGKDNLWRICWYCYMHIQESVHHIFKHIVCCLCLQISFLGSIEHKVLMNFENTNHSHIETYRFDLLDLHKYWFTMTNRRDISTHIIDCYCQQNNRPDILLNIDLKYCLQSKMMICCKLVNTLLLCYHCKSLVKCYWDKCKRIFLMSHLHSIQDLKGI